MKLVKRIATGLLLSSLALSASAAERVGDFALIDHTGAFHHMAWYDDQRAVVLMVQANGAADFRSSLEAFQSLNQQYTGQGVTFFLLNAELNSSRQAVEAELAALGSTLSVLMDDTQLVAETLGVTRIGEAVIYNPKTFEVIYRGPVHNYLENALQQFLADGQVANSSVPATGAPIDFPVLAAHTQTPLSYVNDIAPIIAENCASCHRESGIAPFALDSKQSAQGWSPMIREVVMTRRMPPGQVDNKVGKQIADVPNLSDSDMQKLVHWINAGSPMDGNEDPLAQLTWPDTKWLLGEPDLIVKIPPQSIPATGVVDYMNLLVDIPMAEDRWVRASEVVPGDPTVLHHIITRVVPAEGLPSDDEVLMGIINTLPPEKAQPIRVKLMAASLGGDVNFNEILDMLGEEADIGALLFGSMDPDYASIASYAPGTGPEIYPQGSGGILRVGTKLNLQMHYTTTGRETVDASEIGIYFYPEGEVPQERMSGAVANTFSIEIPPHAKDHEMSSAVVVREDAYLNSVIPHMHFRGKRMHFTAQYPDGTEEMILSVPKYNFNWQLRYQLAEPLLMPAGTRIIATGAFDNSAQNRFNPDPETQVVWGEQSWEEMFMGFFDWKNVNQGTN